MNYFKKKIFLKNKVVLNDINGILNWDMATYMPVKSRGERIKQIKKIYDYKKNIIDEIKKNNLLQKIDITKLSSEDKLNFTLMKEKLDYYEIVPYEKIKKKLHYLLNVKENGEMPEKSLTLIL